MNIPFYILCNSEKEPIRYKFLQEHLPKRGIPSESIHWVKGPWGSELTSEMVFSAWDPFSPRFELDTWITHQGVALSRGEVSLILTFREAIRQILEAGHDRAIVFESDVVLREDFMERLEVILKDERKWDYVSLGEGVGTRPDGCNPSYFSEQKVYEAPHRAVFRCTDSMLLSRSFLEKVWNTLVPFREPMDWELNVQMIIHNGISLWADPPIVEPGSGRSRVASLLPA